MTRRFLDQIAWFFFYQFQHTEQQRRKQQLASQQKDGGLHSNHRSLAIILKTQPVHRWLAKIPTQIDTSDIWILHLEKRFFLFSAKNQTRRFQGCKLGNFLSLASRWIIFKVCLCLNLSDEELLSFFPVFPTANLQRCFKKKCNSNAIHYSLLGF